MTMLRPSRSRWRTQRWQLIGATTGWVVVGLVGAGFLGIGWAGTESVSAQSGNSAQVRFAWSSVPTSVQPPPLKYSAAAYDSDNNTVVVFGGAEADGSLSDNTWVWDGSVWAVYPGSEIQAPPARQMASMAFDPQIHQLILFGGQGIDGQILGDTWAWNGVSWYQQTTAAGATTPPPREAASLAYDGSGQLVMFGGTGQVGLNGSGPGSSPATPTILPSPTTTVAPTTTTLLAAPTLTLGDTWLWNGTNWAQVAAAGPEARSGAAISYDSSDHDAVLFGGETTPADANTAALIGDTWTWNGSAWKQAAPKSSPAARDWAGMGDDLAAQGVVLAAGSGANGALDDTWLWNGTDWTRPPTSGTPSARAGAATAYATTDDQLVIFGGIGPGGTVLGDTALMSTALTSPSGAAITPVATTTVPSRSSRSSIHRGKAGASSKNLPSSTTTGSAPLAVTATTLRRGETVTLAGSGFGPGSTVTITFHSTPQVVGGATADSHGSFEATVSVPDRAAGGAHHFEATGANPSGRTAELAVAVEVIGVPGRPTASTEQTLVMVAVALLLPLAAWLGMAGAGWTRSRGRRDANRAAA